MTKPEVVALMKTSKTNEEWRINANKVKDAFGGDYPNFWYRAIIMDGVAKEVLGPYWGEIRISKDINDLL